MVLKIGKCFYLNPKRIEFLVKRTQGEKELQGILQIDGGLDHLLYAVQLTENAEEAKKQYEQLIAQMEKASDMVDDKLTTDISFEAATPYLEEVCDE